MKWFITRIELHDANTKSDYDTLHEEMEQEGFSRTVTSDDGNKYHLPTAEYFKQGDFTIELVMESAKRAANKTKKKYSVFISESSRLKWYNLPLMSN